MGGNPSAEQVRSDVGDGNGAVGGPGLEVAGVSQSVGESYKQRDCESGDSGGWRWKD